MMDKNLILKIRSGDKQFKEKINNAPYPYSIKTVLVLRISIPMLI